MRPATRAVGGIFLLVVLGGAVSAGVFVSVGSQVAVWSTVAIVPLLVAAGALWVRNTIHTTGTSQTEYAKRRAREVGEQFKQFWERRERVHEAYPELFAQGDSLSVDGVVTDLAERGIEFDTDTGALSLSDRHRDLEEINRLEGEIESLEDRLDAEIADRVRDEVGRVNAEFDRLSDLVAVDPPCVAADVADPDETDDFQWRAVGEQYTAHREWADETVDAAVDRVRSTLESADDVDEATVADHLDDARSARAAGEYAAAVDALLRARDVLRQTGEDVFRSETAALESLVGTVRDSGALRYADDSRVEDLEAVAAEADALDSAMDMDAVGSARADLRRVCLAVLEDLSSDVSSRLAALDRADPPEGYYDRPDAADIDYAARLRDVDDLETFEQRWGTAAEQLTEALDALGPKAEVVGAYDQVAERIEEELRSTGTVEGADLPVREHEEQFLGLYYRQNDGVEFDPSAPLLTTGADGGETHTLEVTVRFETGGSERAATVSVAGPGFEDERTVETHLATTVTFSEVPFGEYTVTATPGVDDSSPATTTVTLDGDAECKLEMADVTLRDRLCDDIDDPDTYLSELGDRFADEFDAEGHLSSAMSFPIDDDYAPCLLAVWADREGHSVTLADDTVLVYDERTLRQEIENVIQYNLEAGETVAFDKLRDTFLSAPVPDEELTALVEGSEEADAVRTDDGALTKGDE
ncbi:hypothetical protein HZS55_04245 [Halosimplex rubrum]|uniref:Coiled-coil protein n=1 Tax=Halosimplex rubrum TaxID=869889 RepID=A0A7D5P3H2_9EURY|nr:hypothetical protein [Halosimplex rubrum]QLH76562.1 hypothetical protein HZS55_04245 [Halosimplex rubrum]